VRHAIDDVDANLPMADIGTSRETVDRAAAQMTFTTALMAVALVACWIPARRASALSPLEALRAD
jgi:ABC-type lipoprotein release transport system permease subunit